MELKAKDGYRSEVLRPLGADALNSLMSLYQPLVGCAGAALYLTLISEPSTSVRLSRTAGYVRS